MGFFPKHIKQRRHRRTMNTIARAVLAGCMFRHHPWRRYWSVVAPNMPSYPFGSKTACAGRYLKFVHKEDYRGGN